MSKNNKVGKGVKVPLSFHLKSNTYSYLMKKIEDIRKIEDLDRDFLNEQYILLQNIQLNSLSDIEGIFVDNAISIHDEVSPYKKIESIVHSGIDCDVIKKELMKCIHYEKIFNKNIEELSEKDRVVLAGTFLRIKTNNNEMIGRKFLISIFSKSNTYNEILTLEKMEELKDLYPPNIQYLNELYNVDCIFCKKNNFTNVIDIFKGFISDEIIIEEKNYFDFEWVKRAEIKYIEQNDEVSSNFIKDEIRYFESIDLKKKFDEIVLCANYNVIKKYKYVRYELKEDRKLKERVLFSLGALDRLLSTYCIFYIFKTYKIPFNENSYGYKINKSSVYNNIFINWNVLWQDFVLNTERRINSEIYKEYTVIKLDIKNFYDSINHKNLYEYFLKDILNQQHEDKKDEFTTIMKYLFNLNTQIVGEIGVPQGPAYARFLAEIYLDRLDCMISTVIDGNFDIYSRYVDDIVILIYSESSVDSIIEQIKDCLTKMRLELNTEKVIVERAENLIGIDIFGKNTDKYFIDECLGINISSRLEDYLIDLLEKMLGEETIDYTQLPFYLTHFFPKISLERKKKIIEFVLSNKYGRGSLFKHFYRRMVFSNE